MTFRDGIGRDLQAKRQLARGAEQERQVQRISDLVPLARTGQISPTKFLTIVRDILNGDADRVVRVGEEFRPDITTGETR
jgi:hypothetical protein